MYIKKLCPLGRKNICEMILIMPFNSESLPFSCVYTVTHMHVYRLIYEYENILLFMSIIDVVRMEIPHPYSFYTGCVDPHTGTFNSKVCKYNMDFPFKAKSVQMCNYQGTEMSRDAHTHI